MSEERNINQIIRKDAKNCFVESLNDSFVFGKIHLTFATYLCRQMEEVLSMCNVLIVMIHLAIGILM